MKGAMLAILFALMTVVLTLTGCTVDCEWGSGDNKCKATISSSCCDAAKDGKDGKDACNDDDKKAKVDCSR